MTHISAVTLWVPAYGPQTALKAVTAVVAIVAAVTIWRQIPRLLALPSPRDLARANLALVQTNASLEATVAWRTYELEQANQRFEQALSRSNITVFTQDTDLRYTWIHNPRLGLTARGDRRPHGAGASPRGHGGRIASDQAPRARDRGDCERRRIGADRARGTIYLDMTASPGRDPEGEIDGVLCTAVDVTEQRLFEVRLASMAAQLGSAYHRFELALENSAITVFEQDPDLRYTYLHNPPEGSEPEDYLDHTDFELFTELDRASSCRPSCA